MEHVLSRVFYRKHTDREQLGLNRWIPGELGRVAAGHEVLPEVMCLANPYIEPRVTTRLPSQPVPDNLGLSDLEVQRSVGLDRTVAALQLDLEIPPPVAAIDVRVTNAHPVLDPSHMEARSPAQAIAQELPQPVFTCH